MTHFWFKTTNFKMLRHIRGTDWNPPVYRCASAGEQKVRERVIWGDGTCPTPHYGGRTIGQETCWRATRAPVSHRGPRTITSRSSMKVRPLATTRHRGLSIQLFNPSEGFQIRRAFPTHLSREPSFDLPLLFHLLLFIASCREWEVERQNI